MSRNFWFVLLTLILTTMIGCEKRIQIDKEFPLEPSKLFCELIGFPERGFLGTISKIKTVQGKESTSIFVQISIWEDELLVINQIHSDDIFIPFQVNPNKKYRLELNYNNERITSESSQVVLPQLKMNNFQATNDYIDSLGINVISTNFDFETPDVITDSIYYVPNFTLSPFDEDYTRLGAFVKPKSILPYKTVNFNKRIANQFNYHAFRMNLFVIDKSLFEYLKYIVQLGQIPNDNIEGHHGNISGGVGYFGIINFDTRFVYF